jgi:ribosome biogenesis GTPase
MNTLNKLGWSSSFETLLSSDELNNMNIGRVSTVNKTNYHVIHESGTKLCELAGNLLYGLEDHEKPQTGDWVIFLDYGDMGIINKVVPRMNYLSRKKAGKDFDEQILAANIDFAIVVQCMEIGLNLRRLERTIVQIQNCKIEPIVIINKMDLPISEEDEHSLNTIQNKYGAIPISARAGKNVNKLTEKIQEGKSYVLIGASGVGKSSIVNALENQHAVKTGAISDAVKKGSHTTTTRDLYLLNNGGIMIDTPGTREFGLTSDGEGATAGTFLGIDELAGTCKFHNCTHTGEKGCKVLKALGNGSISEEEYQNFMKMQREMDHYSSSNKARKEKGKNLSKIIKNMKKSGYKKDRY